ncbi:MAG TPA: serine hydroxymethyltransferase [Ancylobacter sp.]
MKSASPSPDAGLDLVRSAAVDDIAWLHSGYFSDNPAQADPAVARLIAAEQQRQREAVELVASENFVSRAVLAAQGSVFTNKTVVGYPGRRFHAGAEWADELERLAIERACAAFGCAYANVQPHSGIQANLAVFRALLTPDDVVLSMSGQAGGHFSHGGQSNLSGAMAKGVFYDVHRETGLIDYEQVRALARTHRPKLIVAGGASYPRAIDFAALRAVADEIGARLLVDIAHFAGLVVAGVHPHPFPFADIVTTTTYKSLRGARGGLILWNDPALADALAKAVSPGVQGSPLLHAVAAKAICLGEVLRPEFAAYGRAVLDNARAMAGELMASGIDVLTSGTDTPLVVANLKSLGLSGQAIVESLDRAGITCNRCEIPFDDVDPAQTSGLRFGLSACTTRGLGPEDVRTVAGWIAELISGHARHASGIRQCETDIRMRAAALMTPRPLYADAGSDIR